MAGVRKTVKAKLQKTAWPLSLPALHGDTLCIEVRLCISSTYWNLSLCFLLFLDNKTNNKNNYCRNDKTEHVYKNPKIEWCRIQSVVVSAVINNSIDNEAKEQQDTQSIAHCYAVDFLHTITLLRKFKFCELFVFILPHEKKLCKNRHSGQNRCACQLSYEPRRFGRAFCILKFNRCLCPAYFLFSAGCGKMQYIIMYKVLL